MTVLIVIGGILLLLLLLGMLNLKFYMRYENEVFTLKLGVLCFWKQLVPQQEKKLKSSKQKPKKSNKAKNISPKATQVQNANVKNSSASGSLTTSKSASAAQKHTGQSNTQKHTPPKKDWKETVTMIYDIIRSIIRPTRFVLRHLRFTGLRLHVVVGGEEPDETAIAYGRWNAAVYGGLATIRNFFNLRVKKMMIAVDFTSKETTVFADGTLKIRMYVLLVSAMRMLWHILVNTLGRQKEAQSSSGQAAASA